MAQDDLFGNCKTVREKKDTLWESATTEVRHSNQFLELCLDHDVWDEKEEDLRDLRRRAHRQEIREYVHERSPRDGRKRSYKTDETGGLIPQAYANKQQRLFDLQFDAKQSSADRERIRQDIRIYYADFGVRPEGIDPWHWSDEDHEEWTRRAA